MQGCAEAVESTGVYLKVWTHRPLAVKSAFANGRPGKQGTFKAAEGGGIA